MGVHPTTSDIGPARDQHRILKQVIRRTILLEDDDNVLNRGAKNWRSILGATILRQQECAHAKKGNRNRYSGPKHPSAVFPPIWQTSPIPASCNKKLFNKTSSGLSAADWLPFASYRLLPRPLERLRCLEGSTKGGMVTIRIRLPGWEIRTSRRGHSYDFAVSANWRSPGTGSLS